MNQIHTYAYAYICAQADTTLQNEAIRQQDKDIMELYTMRMYYNHTQALAHTNKSTTSYASIHPSMCSARQTETKHELCKWEMDRILYMEWRIVEMTDAHKHIHTRISRQWVNTGAAIIHFLHC